MSAPGPARPESLPPPLVLASASPRRAELLERVGYSFSVRAADVDESAFPDERPSDYVARLAAAIDPALTAAALAETQRRDGLDEQIRTLTARPVLTAEQAKEYGIVDEVITTRKLTV